MILKLLYISVPSNLKPASISSKQGAIQVLFIAWPNVEIEAVAVQS